MPKSTKSIDESYQLAKTRYAEIGVDTEAAMAKLATIPISLHCWQGDDVGGFENTGDGLSGGIAVTGNYPGKARTPDELRADLDKALSLIPGKHRLNLHAFYGEFGDKKVDRNEIAPEHFQNWIDWAKSNGMGMDFNPTNFAHPKAADGFTLSNTKKEIRDFWIEHCKRSREISAVMGEQLGSPCVMNMWIPDGYKDTPYDRVSPRQRLSDSLDEIYAKDLNPAHMLDAVECKLFGIGSESYVVGSHEFYMGYAMKNQKLLCLDAGHFHPTEGIADKLGTVLMYVPEILLHVSRGVRWDSDHVVTLDDALQSISAELVRNDLLSRTHIGLDFFDASINRIAAWTIGTRNTLKSLLMALLEPAALKEAEANGDLTTRLALMEELKTLPWGAVWDRYCETQDVPAGMAWLDETKKYESEVLSKR
ncbi:MAG: L-rhamnose isomerase [Akkermansiaceae bacterium]|nr:L-rhamnose isomerase [Akkermansiaceae bacterium]MDP4646992.1 L-rhamnose isomerase [Akkermansiaceae bacterium]MDP4722638.1 L-rhamnose isomerase [Akkermansiaceae bacterium]MDP4780223.1 L-rhamnose isomerase [Akkermansiaceae bacterium]MDP4847528.1 L-rhamnose isomerase [Akkermansiaceae bacterium]